jgi:tetratricopeptide (TPR) repeat protein
LRIREASLSPGNLADAQRIQRRYDLSLEYELKCFSIREKILPPNDQSIGKSLSRIGECYERLDQLKLALDHYKRTLIVYEQFLPVLNKDRLAMESTVNRLSARVEAMNI